ncbi:nitroreductase family protein [Actinospongicola halichondriae]|uniref:nitroreductase family protein n=1 Tax=Actinospongicola halichondriae TaxID=3236844 RepID=UPI003D3E431C
MTAGGDGLEPLARVIRRRRMVRAFADTPVDDDLLDDLLDLTRRAPSAGNTQPWELLVLRGDRVARYWETTLADPSGFRWQGLLAAPVLVIPYVRPDAYAERYAEDDKASTGLGAGPGSWPVPYWWIDGGAAVENLLLAATAAGLGACLFGQFDHEPSVRAAFDVPDDRRAIGTIALGHPAPDEPGRSATRERVALDDVVHRDRW